MVVVKDYPEVAVNKRLTGYDPTSAAVGVELVEITQFGAVPVS